MEENLTIKMWYKFYCLVEHEINSSLSVWNRNTPKQSILGIYLILTSN